MTTIRKGTAEDIQAAFDLVMELAIYEKAPEKVTNTPARMLEDGFGKKPIFEFYVAEVDGKVVGMALYYIRYSTWRGKCIYLEDIVVTESHRGKNLGKLLLEVLMHETLAQDAALLTWQVLDWNEPAINFYKKFDAELDGEWINCKLSAEQISNYFTKS
jgi:GNAT superfamily N-acetyltransferase